MWNFLRERERERERERKNLRKHDDYCPTPTNDLKIYGKKYREREEECTKTGIEKDNV